MDPPESQHGGGGTAVADSPEAAAADSSAPVWVDMHRKLNRERSCVSTEIDASDVGGRSDTAEADVELEASDPASHMCMQIFGGREPVGSSSEAVSRRGVSSPEAVMPCVPSSSSGTEGAMRRVSALHCRALAEPWASSASSPSPSSESTACKRRRFGRENRTSITSELYQAVASEHALAYTTVKGVIESAVRLTDERVKEHGSCELGGPVKLLLQIESYGVPDQPDEFPATGTWSLRDDDAGGEGEDEEGEWAHGEQDSPSSDELLRLLQDSPAAEPVLPTTSPIEVPG